MNKFLSHQFRTILAPELDNDGQVIHNRNGETSCIAVSKKEAISISSQLCGSTNAYLTPWFVHIDWNRPEDDTLVCLDPNEPKTNNARLSDFIAQDNGRITRAIKAASQCPYLGTIKCTRTCTRCDDCPSIGTKKCRRCKTKCEECQLDGTTRVISRDNTFTDSDNEETSMQYDTADTTNIPKEYEDRELLSALYTALGTVDKLTRTVLHYTYKEERSERWIAEKLGCKSKTQIVRVREKALAALRESLKDYKN